MSGIAGCARRARSGPVGLALEARFPGAKSLLLRLRSFFLPVVSDHFSAFLYLMCFSEALNFVFSSGIGVQSSVSWYSLVSVVVKACVGG